MLAIGFRCRLPPTAKDAETPPRNSVVGRGALEYIGNHHNSVHQGYLTPLSIFSGVPERHVRH